MKTTLATLALMSLISNSSADSGDAIPGTSGQVGPVVASISRKTDRPGYPAPSEHFTGQAFVEPLFSANAPARTSAAFVTFQPGARTDWHVHPLGQTLVVTAGIGFIQFWGGPVQQIAPGDVVWIPPRQKHWHGASQAASMTHIAIQEQLDGKTVDWSEKVGNDQYPAAGSRGQKSEPPAAPSSAPQTSRAQQLLGDIAPKLADLTDNVLFGDVWERPGLAKRDRSLITVAALIAMNRPDQLRSHLDLARQNGVTQDELVEAITHLAFYAGWPSAVSAATVARDVFQQKEQK